MNKNKKEMVNAIKIQADEIWELRRNQFSSLDVSHNSLLLRII